MAQRDQVAGLLGGHDAGDARHVGELEGLGLALALDLQAQVLLQAKARFGFGFGSHDLARPSPSGPLLRSTGHAMWRRRGKGGDCVDCPDWWMPARTGHFGGFHLDGVE